MVKNVGASVEAPISFSPVELFLKEIIYSKQLKKWVVPVKYTKK